MFIVFLNNRMNNKLFYRTKMIFIKIKHKLSYIISFHIPNDEIEICKYINKMIQFLMIFEFWFSIEMSSPADDQANWFTVNNICITDIKNST